MKIIIFILLLLVPQISLANFCDQCGVSLSASSKFCSQCGTKIGSNPKDLPDLRVDKWRTFTVRSRGGVGQYQLRAFFKSHVSAQVGDAMAIYEVGKNWDETPRLVSRGTVMQVREDGQTELWVRTCRYRMRRPIDGTRFIVTKRNHTNLSNRDFLQILNGNIMKGVQVQYVEPAWGKIQHADKVGNIIRQFYAHDRIIYVRNNRIIKTIEGRDSVRQELKIRPKSYK